MKVEMISVVGTSREGGERMRIANELRICPVCDTITYGGEVCVLEHTHHTILPSDKDGNILMWNYRDDSRTHRLRKKFNLDMDKVQEEEAKWWKCPNCGREKRSETQSVCEWRRRHGADAFATVDDANRPKLKPISGTNGHSWVTKTKDVAEYLDMLLPQTAWCPVCNHIANSGIGDECPNCHIFRCSQCDHLTARVVGAEPKCSECGYVDPKTKFDYVNPSHCNKCASLTPHIKQD